MSSKNERKKNLGRGLSSFLDVDSFGEIVDKKRISLILKNIKKKSIKNNIDPKTTNRIWKNMIMSYIDFEKRNFKKK